MPSEEKYARRSAGELREVLPPDDVIFGNSAVMAGLRNRASRVCGTGVHLLLYGHAGTGKEVLARWIHAKSGYPTGHFVSINCAAIPSALLESELFGYEKGAFTGANTGKAGKCELAHNGTLFLDEIEDLDLGLQSKLLHFLQDGSFSHIGGDAEIRVNTQIICATSKDLEEEVAAGRFRSDLYHRINVMQLRLPRLRERKEDIPVLAEHFREQYAKKFGKESKPLGEDMLKRLQEKEWRGNLRELANCIARHVLIGPEAAMGEEQSPKHKDGRPSLAGQGSRVSLKHITREAIRELERSVILGALRANRWNRRKTASALKISYRTLIYKIHKAGFS